MHRLALTSVAFLALGALGALAPAAAAEPPARFSGQLERELVPNPRFMMTIPLKPYEGGPLPQPAVPGESVSTGVATELFELQPMQVVWLEGAGRAPRLYADLDRDGRFAAAELFSPTPLPEAPSALGNSCASQFVVPAPMPGTFFRSFPLILCRPATWTKGEPPLLASYFAKAVGTVEVGGRRFPVSYSVDPVSGQVDLLNGRHELDGNGDGTLEQGFGATEWAQATGSAPVMRAGDLYVSTEAIDPAGGKIELRAHPATDFVRAELRPGLPMPDFELTDLAGGKRRLSDLRGKHVLLDFWNTTCAPCIAEFPHLKKAYETYRERGLEILGMVIIDPRDKVAPFVAKHALPWPQASWESIRDVAQARFGVLALPRVILLDPEGKILSTGEPGQLPLRGEGLVQTLEERLPARKAAR